MCVSIDVCVCVYICVCLYAEFFVEVAVCMYFVYSIIKLHFFFFFFFFLGVMGVIRNMIMLSFSDKAKKVKTTMSY